MKYLALLFVLFVSSCASTTSPTAQKKFDPGAKDECIDICKKAKMSFQSLVVIGGMAGCVCQNSSGGDQSSAHDNGAMGGAVAMLIAQQQAAAAEQERQNQLIQQQQQSAKQR